MSSKSIGYRAVSLPDGLFESAEVTIDSEGQIVKLSNQSITPEGESLQQDFDDLEAIVENSQGLQAATQVLLKSLQSSLPALLENQELLISQVLNLQAQYDILETEFAAITPRFTPELVLERTPLELNIGNIPQAVDTLIDTINLDSGIYTIFFNAVGTLNYISGPAQPPNPYTEQFTSGFIDDDNFGLNTMCASFVSNGTLVGTISTSQFSVSGSLDSTAAAPQLRLTSVINGSTTFQLTENQDIDFFLRWNNSSILYFATSETELTVFAGADDTTFIDNVPVIQTGKSFSIWKVGL